MVSWGHSGRGEGIRWWCGQGGWATTSRSEQWSSPGRWTARGRRGGEGRDAAEQGILGGRCVDDGEQGGDGAPVMEVGLEAGGSTAAIPPVRNDGEHGHDQRWRRRLMFHPVHVLLCPRATQRRRRQVSDRISRSHSSIEARASPLIHHEGREDSGDDGDGAGNPWRGFPLWDEDGDGEQGGDLGQQGDREQGGDLGRVGNGEESTSGRRRVVSQEEITGGRHR